MKVDDIFEIDIILRLCKAESEDVFSDDFFGNVIKAQPEKVGFSGDF